MTRQSLRQYEQVFLRVFLCDNDIAITGTLWCLFFLLVLQYEIEGTDNRTNKVPN
jgi:hypothetical protein